MIEAYQNQLQKQIGILESELDRIKQKQLEDEENFRNSQDEQNKIVPSFGDNEIEHT